VGNRARYIRDHEDRLDTDDALHTENHWESSSAAVGAEPSLQGTSLRNASHGRRPARQIPPRHERFLAAP
jgi:hypothetical protein